MEAEKGRPRMRLVRPFSLSLYNFKFHIDLSWRRGLKAKGLTGANVWYITLADVGYSAALQRPVAFPDGGERPRASLKLF